MFSWLCQEVGHILDTCVGFMSTVVSQCGSYSGSDLTWMDNREKLSNSRKILIRCACLLFSNPTFFLMHPTCWNSLSWKSGKHASMGSTLSSFFPLDHVSSRAAFLALVQTHIKQILLTMLKKKISHLLRGLLILLIYSPYSGRGIFFKFNEIMYFTIFLLNFFTFKIFK